MFERCSGAHVRSKIFLNSLSLYNCVNNTFYFSSPETIRRLLWFINFRKHCFVKSTPLPYGKSLVLQSDRSADEQHPSHPYVRWIPPAFIRPTTTGIPRALQQNSSQPVNLLVGLSLAGHRQFRQLEGRHSMCVLNLVPLVKSDLVRDALHIALRFSLWHF